MGIKREGEIRRWENRGGDEEKQDGWGSGADNEWMGRWVGGEVGRGAGDVGLV